MSNFELLLSFPPPYSVFYILDDRTAILSRRVEGKINRAHEYYHYLEERLDSEKPSREVIASLINKESKYYVLDEEDRKATVIKEQGGNEILNSDEYLGYIKIETKKSLYLYRSERRAGTITCIDIKSGTLKWQVKGMGKLEKHRLKNALLCLKKGRGTTEILWLSKENGSLLQKKEFPYRVYIREAYENMVILGAFIIEGQLSIVKYRPDMDKVDVIELESDISDYHGMRSFDDSLYRSMQESQFEVWKESKTGAAKVVVNSISTGKIKGKLSLPNLLLHSLPDFFKVDDTYGLIGQSRKSWPNNYWQLVTWNARDIKNSTHEIYEEHLIGESERIKEGNESYYRVFIGSTLENFFQLHRQLSVKLHQVASSAGFHREAKDDKSMDNSFGGSLVCDVSNHALNDREKLAIKHMCQHMESQLRDRNFRASTDHKRLISIRSMF